MKEIQLLFLARESLSLGLLVLLHLYYAFYVINASPFAVSLFKLSNLLSCFSIVLSRSRDSSNISSLQWGVCEICNFVCEGASSSASGCKAKIQHEMLEPLGISLVILYLGCL